jgi:hypothetical protein
MRFFCFAFFTLAATACGTSSAPPADGGHDASGLHEAGADAATDATTDAPTPADAGDAGSPPDGGPDLGGPDLGDFDLGTFRDLGTDANTDSGGDACGFVTTLDTSCTGDGDCAYDIHQTDCCGNTHAVGFNVSESAGFPALEAACDATYPRCGCPVHPTVTDSGETVGDPTAIQVACVARGPRNVCLTYISTRPPDAP